MRFGPVPVADAVGARLAHSAVAGRRLPKGHVVTEADVLSLLSAGLTDIVVARMDADDVAEDEAAARLANLLATGSISRRAAATGRCNLHADRDGLFTVDRSLVEAVNAIDPSITFATLADAVPVRAGRMVATVKIIPFAVPRDCLAAAERVIEASREAVVVRPYRSLRVAMISTLLPSLKKSVVAKTERVTDERLRVFGGRIVSHEKVAHETPAVAEAIQRTNDADLVLVFGASAVADEQDVVPAAIRAAEGGVETVGMPVDPGNLLCIGRVGDRTVIGAPGCARSPAENGFDWVLQRHAAGLPLTREWVRSLGVGGLLMEIESRPAPRERLPVIVLAAGRSRRMGARNKLTLELEDKPVLAHAVDAALAADIGPVVVVTGHQPDAIRTALSGRDVTYMHNKDFAEGMSTSLKVGLSALGNAPGAMVLLGDMPDLRSSDLKRLADTFRHHGEARIVAARDAETGRRGNPVIWPRSFQDALQAIEGDTGARALLEAEEIVTVDMTGAALDLDTPEAFASRRDR